MTKKGTLEGRSTVRKRQAWGLHIEGYTQQQIATQLKIAQQSVCNLLKSARKEYHDEFMLEIDDVVQSQVAILWDMFRESRDSWKKSKSVGPYGEHPNNQFGDVKYLNACAYYMAEIRKILGADAPIKFDMDFDVTKYSLEDLRRISEAKSPSELIATGTLGK